MGKAIANKVKKATNDKRTVKLKFSGTKQDMKDGAYVSRFRTKKNMDQGHGMSSYWVDK